MAGLHGAWAPATDGNPFTTHLNAVTKYVVSRSLGDAGAWQNSVLLRGLDDVAALDGDLSIVGSAALVRSLHAGQSCPAVTKSISRSTAPSRSDSMSR